MSRRPAPPPRAPALPEAGPPVLAPWPGPALPGDPGVSLAPGRPLPALALPQLRAQLLGLGDSLPRVPALHTLSSSLPSGPLPLICRPRGPWGPPAASQSGEDGREESGGLQLCSRTEGAKQRHGRSPPPTTVPPALPPLSAGGEGSFCLGRGTQARAPHVHTEAPAKQGRGQLC